MITVAISGTFNAKRGDMIRITEAYFYNRSSIRTPSIENLSTGEVGSFDRPRMTIPLQTLDPPIIGRVEKLERHSSDTIITLDEISREAFLSYNTEDKNIAGKIKEELEKFNIKSFLAHEEVEISSEWRNEIHKHLDSSDLFLPLITDNFNLSVWANQETGYAIAKNKIIVPLIFDETKITGLVEERQGIKIRTDDIEAGINKLITEIKRAHSSLLNQQND